MEFIERNFWKTWVYKTIGFLQSLHRKMIFVEDWIMESLLQVILQLRIIIQAPNRSKVLKIRTVGNSNPMIWPPLTAKNPLLAQWFW